MSGVSREESHLRELAVGLRPSFSADGLIAGPAAEWVQRRRPSTGRPLRHQSRYCLSGGMRTGEPNHLSGRVPLLQREHGRSQKFRVRIFPPEPHSKCYSASLYCEATGALNS